MFIFVLFVDVYFRLIIFVNPGLLYRCLFLSYSSIFILVLVVDFYFRVIILVNLALFIQIKLKIFILCLRVIIN